MTDVSYHNLEFSAPTLDAFVIPKYLVTSVDWSLVLRNFKKDVLNEIAKNQVTQPWKHLSWVQKQHSINLLFVSNSIIEISSTMHVLTLFRMGGCKKPLPIKVFFFLTKTFWILVLTLLPHWCKISRPCLVPVTNYWIWIQSIPQKSCFFWSNFCHMTTST